MRICLSMESATPLRDVADYVRLVERIGFDGVEIPETTHDGLLVATLAAEHTTTLDIGTSVILAFPRSPMTVAVAAWDLQAFSGGRFRLGIGSQIRANIEGRFATAWTTPAPRMRDYVTSLRAIWDAFQNGTGLTHETENYSFTRLQPMFNPGPVEHPDIPIVLGGVNKEMCMVAGELADGIVTHPTNASTSYFESVLRPSVAAGAAHASREPKAVDVNVIVQVITGRNRRELATSLDAARPVLAGVFSTPAYRWTLASLGREDLSDRLRQLSREGRWAEMTALVDDDLLGAVATVAVHDELADALHERYAPVADAVSLMLPLRSSDEAGLARVVADLRSR